MSDPAVKRDTRGDSGDRGSSTGMPRWAWVSLIIVGALIALFLVLKVAGLGGNHGPGRHMGPHGLAKPTATSNFFEHRPLADEPNGGF